MQKDDVYQKRKPSGMGIYRSSNSLEGLTFDAMFNSKTVEGNQVSYDVKDSDLVRKALGLYMKGSDLKVVDGERGLTVVDGDQNQVFYFDGNKLLVSDNGPVIGKASKKRLVIDKNIVQDGNLVYDFGARFYDFLQQNANGYFQEVDSTKNSFLRSAEGAEESNIVRYVVKNPDNTVGIFERFVNQYKNGDAGDDRDAVRIITKDSRPKSLVKKPQKKGSLRERVKSFYKEDSVEMTISRGEYIIDMNTELGVEFNAFLEGMHSRLVEKVPEAQSTPSLEKNDMDVAYIKLIDPAKMRVALQNFARSYYDMQDASLEYNKRTGFSLKNSEGSRPLRGISFRSVPVTERKPSAGSKLVDFLEGGK